MEADDEWTIRWAASGAAGLSGRADDAPLDVPAAMVRLACGAADQIESASAELGAAVALDGCAALAERAALMGLTRRGDVSCGGATRLLETADGWIAVSLARESDVVSVPAWLGISVPAAAEPGDELWIAVRDAVRTWPTVDVVERGALLGMPVARLGEVDAGGSAPAVARRTGAAERIGSMGDVLVVDLSALWAGPLVAHVLGLAGARVIKVESAQRPDGARLGPPEFYDLLHAGHESVCLDFADPLDIGVLRRLIERSDVVIESSRPRALQQLGLDPDAFARGGVDGPRVWVSISGHGRDEANAGRVGFGDDAAVAGGLVTADAAGPCFCADAVADPLTGLVGAAQALQALQRGDRWSIDVALARVAAGAAGGPRTAIAGHHLAAPRARPARGSAAQLGEHTAAVISELG